VATTLDTSPEVSIGVPVYNGARFLRKSIDSLLGQTFGDFELILSDNASSDETQEICDAYVRADRRVRCFRQPRNLGATRNWNFVVQMATGKYFKWASANDYCEPHMLAECTAVLRQNADVVVCYGRTELIDDDGNALGLYEHDPEIMDGRPSHRFRRLLTELSLNNAQSGLIRISALRRTRLERFYPGGDQILMAELAMLGGYRLLPMVLLHRRMGKASTTRFLSARELREFHDPQANARQLPAWRNHSDCIYSALRAPLGFWEKLSVLEVALRRSYWERGKLWQELRSRTLGNELHGRSSA
jgi:glycosyltransferase involved in cell wall biosynthesis